MLARHRDTPGVGREYLYRLPPEAGGGEAWLSDATGGAPVVGYRCADGVERTAYAVLDPVPPPRTPTGRIATGRPHSLDVRLSEAERADVVALADVLGTSQADAIRVAVRAELARRAP